MTKVKDKMNKYKLTDETIIHNGVTLYRIEALKDFANIRAGEKGGFVQSEFNLSHNGGCWVYGDAKVYGNAKVFDYAKVFDNALICGNAKVYGDAKVFDNALICCDAEVYGKAEICHDAEVYGKADVFGNAKVYGNALICGNAKVYGDAEVDGNAKVYGNAKVFDYAKVYDNALICGNAKVYGDAEVDGNAKICSNRDYIVFKNWWSSGRYFTWTKSNNMWKVGCFYGTSEELIKKAYSENELKGKEYERIVKYVDSILDDEMTTITYVNSDFKEKNIILK